MLLLYPSPRKTQYEDIVNDSGLSRRLKIEQQLNTDPCSIFRHRFCPNRIFSESVRATLREVVALGRRGTQIIISLTLGICEKQASILRFKHFTNVP